VCSIRNAACHSRRASDTLTPLASPHAFPPWQATAPQQAADRLPAPPADRVFIVTLVVGFFAIALLLVMLYPSPLHLLGLI
jgi:hypothetical protein